MRIISEEDFKMFAESFAEAYNVAYLTVESFFPIKLYVSISPL